MTITVPNTLTQGDVIQVCIASTTRASQSVEVTIDDGGDNEEKVQVPLDEHGVGCASWTVPAWSSANFNDDRCAGVQRTINPPPPGG